MEQLNSIVSVLALTMGAAWASGINLYAAMLVLGWLGATGSIDLPPALEMLQNPMVVTIAGLMFCVEFFADKIPGVDSGWDAIQTFIRIPAGAVLAAGALGPVDPSLAIAAALVGGGVTAATHATKAGSRVLINTSPEPFSNWTASLTEDVAVVAGLWTAVNHPWLFLALFIFFMLFVVWALPKLWRSIKKVFAALGRLFGLGSSPSVDRRTQGIEPALRAETFPPMDPGLDPGPPMVDPGQPIYPGPSIDPVPPVDPGPSIDPPLPPVDPRPPADPIPPIDPRPPFDPLPPPVDPAQTRAIG